MEELVHYKMKYNKFKGLWIALLIIGAMFIISEAIAFKHNWTISQRCGGTVIEVDGNLKVYQRQGYTKYVGVAEVGKCKVPVKGRVNTLTNLDAKIKQDVINDLNQKKENFRRVRTPGDVTRSFYFTIP